MNLPADLMVAIVASVPALVSLSLALAVRILAHRSAKGELHSLQITDTGAAIQSADLNTLGYNLVSRLGETSIRSYTSNDELRAEFDEAFNAIRAYLGAPASDRTPSEDGGTRPQSEEPIIDEETWTKLARGRRDLERSLRATLGVTDTEPQKSADQLIQSAEAGGRLDPQQAATLRGAMKITNAAIHGNNIPRELADQAARAINAFLETSQPKNTNWQQRSRRIEVRSVTPDPTGGWQVVAPDAPRASERFSTKSAAVSRARNIVHNKGGGEVTIHSRDGRITSKDTVRGSGGVRDRNPIG